MVEQWEPQATPLRKILTHKKQVQSFSPSVKNFVFAGTLTEGANLRKLTACGETYQLRMS